MRPALGARIGDVQTQMHPLIECTSATILRMRSQFLMSLQMRMLPEKNKFLYHYVCTFR